MINESLKNRLERTRAVREEFVVPLYGRLLHANFTKAPRPTDQLQRTEEEISATCAQIASAARSISNEQLTALLSDGGWRERLVAGWLVGLSRRVEFVETIAALLLASVQPYSGQGYCVALGLIGSGECRRHLTNYLTRYLPLHGRRYDQEWAIGALAYIDQMPPQEFLIEELWTDGTGSLKPSKGIERFAALVQLLDTHSMRIP